MVGFMFDCETGGLLPKVHGLTEVAVIAFDVSPGGLSEVAYYHSLVKPVESMAYTPKALQIAGLSLERLEAEGTNEADVYDGFMSFVASQGGSHVTRYSSPGRFWSHNSVFDHGFVKAWSMRQGHPADFPDRDDWGCTKKLFRSLCHLGRYDSAYDGLDKVAAFLGVERTGDAHSALSDARLALACLERMMTHTLVTA